MNRYFTNKCGGNLNFYKGPTFQKGYGLGDQFKRFYRWIVPLFKKHAVPHIESGLKTIGKEVLYSASNIAKDVAEGRNLKDSTQSNLNASINNLKEVIETKLNALDSPLNGKGLNKKRKLKSFVLPILKK